MTQLDSTPQPVGILVNPSSGRDVRRLAARASVMTAESKRDQIARAVVGAVASGAQRVLVIRDLLRIAERAVENLRLHAEIELIEQKPSYQPRDTAIAAQRLRDEGCGAVVVFGGDGTNRILTKAWPDAPIVPLSTGTNNVFPIAIEAGVGGAAAGLLASGQVSAEEVAPRAKIVAVEIDGEADDCAVVDAALLVDDSVGNLLPYDPDLIRRVVLARAEPAAVGVSPIGGLLEPSSASDEFGVDVRCEAGEGSARPMLVPISPGLYRRVGIVEVQRLALGEVVEVEGPGVLAFDGDRERQLEPGQKARLRVVREGPRVIDVGETLRLAASRGSYLHSAHWHDELDTAGVSFDCC
ncbi:NAD(+)/NADH kinase [Myxococcota bacterium]|nr:NAD(+)/NADH kinase [Myxococcota bacterium]